MKQKHNILQWLLLFWIAVFLLLLFAGSRLPSIEEITKDNTSIYTHPQDQYTVHLVDSWQVSQNKEKSLLLVDLKTRSTLRFTLEVGGTDYLSLAQCAKKTIAAVKKEQSIAFRSDSPAIIGGAYDGIRFSGSVEKDGEGYIEEFFILHPNEGIRLYAVYTYPEETSIQAIQETEEMVASIVFLDFNGIYKNYMND